MQYPLLLAAAFQLAQAHEHGHARFHHQQNQHKRDLTTVVDVEIVTVYVTVTAGGAPGVQTPSASSSSSDVCSTSTEPAVPTTSSSTFSTEAAWYSTSQSSSVASSAAPSQYSSSSSASYAAPSEYSTSSSASYAAPSQYSTSSVSSYAAPSQYSSSSTISSSSAPVSSAASSSSSVATYVYAQSSSTTSAAAASTSAASSGQTYSGEATFYGGNVAGGTCSFSTYTLPSGLYGTALSSSNWNSSANCGGCVNVSYGGKSITAMIVDQCPSCGDNHLDLFPGAFSALADASLGIIDVTWEYTDCSAVTGPLEIHMKSGVTQYWFSAQVVNGNDRTASMEVSTDGGSTWTSTERQDYNFFQISSGVGADTATVRVTSFGGSVVTVDNVSMTSDATVKASGNY